MKTKLAPSMMCASYANLINEIKAIDTAGVDFLHCDIMDGHYVPNLIAGPDYIKTLRRISDTRIDLHLMVEKPENFIDMFEMQPGERICFHFETTYHPQRLVTQLKKRGLETGIALAPSVPVVMIEDLLEDIDFVHIMMVNPGYAGQPLIPAMMNKVIQTRRMLKERGLDLDIEVDGCVDYDNTIEFIKNGATTLVLGVYSCFDKELGIDLALNRVKNIVRDAENSGIGSQAGVRGVF